MSLSDGSGSIISHMVIDMDEIRQQTVSVRHALRGQLLRAAFGDLDIAGYKHMMRKQFRFQTTSTRFSQAEFCGQPRELCRKTVVTYQINFRSAA